MAKQSNKPSAGEQTPPIDTGQGGNPGEQTPPADTLQELVGGATIRTRFHVESIQDLSSRDVFQKRVYMHPVRGGLATGEPSENTSFAVNTPSAVFELLNEREELDGFFKSGKQYFIDITEVEPAAPAV
ncbi:hypothetical protein [Spirosoma aerolatum]|uniref:hypothetical protein n=1 Tax=Spirosoma aerolatum TaxID=1211326 RepID=UPI0009AD0518|nr:hypothetical protein [Spirosoma aerolatum]